MTYFELTEAGLRKKIRGGEKLYGYIMLFCSIFLVTFLVISGYIELSWNLLIASFVFLWLATEFGAYFARHQRYRLWAAFRIGYENDRLVEERKVQQVAEIWRDQVESIEETRFGLLITAPHDSIVIPYEINQYEDLLVLLRNWEFVEQRSSRRQRQFKNAIRNWFDRFEVKKIPSFDMFKASYREQRVIPARRNKRRGKLIKTIESFLGPIEHIVGGVMCLGVFLTFFAGVLLEEETHWVFPVAAGVLAVSLWGTLLGFSYFKIMTSWEEEGYFTLIIISVIFTCISLGFFVTSISMNVENAF